MISHDHITLPADPEYVAEFEKALVAIEELVQAHVTAFAGTNFIKNHDDDDGQIFHMGMDIELTIDANDDPIVYIIQHWVNPATNAVGSVKWRTAELRSLDEFKRVIKNCAELIQIIADVENRKVKDGQLRTISQYSG